MPATSFSELIGSFELRLEGLVERFEIPVPDIDPYSQTCPPVHDDAQVFLSVFVQNEWSEFSKSLITLSDVGGQTTLSGSTIPQNFSLSASRQRVRNAASTVAKKLGTNYPVWHSCGFAVAVAEELGLLNTQAINLGLGGNLSADYFTRVRNYVIHPEAGSRSKYASVAAAIGLPRAQPGQLLRSVQEGGGTLFRNWTEDLKTSARIAAQ